MGVIAEGILRVCKGLFTPVPIRLLPGDSAPLGVINTAATRGGDGSHSRGGGGDTSPGEKKNEGENCLDHGPKSPLMANHGTKLGV